MSTNPYQSPHSVHAIASDAEEPFRPIPSGVLLAAMPLYLALNWAALSTCGPNRLWETFDVFTFVAPPLCLASLALTQAALHPFRWWHVVVAGAFLVGMAALNHFLAFAIALGSC